MQRPHPLFDPEYYLTNNPDVAASGDDPFVHFMQHGAFEGRKPNPFFDPKFYLDTYPDVARAKDNPLAHYVAHGAAEGRDPSPLFDTDWYLAQNSDVAASGTNPLAHYLERGRLEGRQPRPDAGSQEKTKFERRAVTAEAAPALAHAPPPVVPEPVSLPAPEALRLENNDEQIKFHIDKPQQIYTGAEVAVRKSLLVEGWAIARCRIASIDTSVGTRPLGSAHYGLPRWDVARDNPGWPNAQESGFMVTIPSRLLAKGKNTIRISFCDKLGRVRPFEFKIDVAAHVADELMLRNVNQVEVEFYERILKNIQWHPSFYILLLVRRGTEKGLQDTLLSLRRQAYDDWRIGILAEPPASEPYQSLTVDDQKRTWRQSLLADFRDIVDRIEFLEEQSDTRLAELARGGDSPIFFGLLAAGDTISNDALLQFAVKTGVERDGEFFYSDEVRISPASRELERFLKPQWSPDLALSTNYIGRLWIATEALLERAGPTLRELLAWGEYDLVLRLTETARRICHIPEVLCRRGAEHLDSEPTEQAALERALSRRKIEASVHSGFTNGVYRVHRKLTDRQLVSVIMPVGRQVELLKKAVSGLLNETRCDRLELILVANTGTSPNAFPYFETLQSDARVKVIHVEGHFNFSRLCNLGAQNARGKFLLFLNDDVEIVDSAWLDALLEHIRRPEVGVVGPMLLWPNRTIQSAGVFLTDRVGIEAHAFRNLAESEAGYFGLAQTERNVIAINGACFMTRRDVFDKVGGFNEAHRVVNNETDYCLKAWREGYRLVYTPYAKLIHHERASRTNESDDYDAAGFKQQWGAVFADGDPFHHPALSKERENFTPEAEPVRAVHPGNPLATRQSIKSVLIVKLDHIGDCITAFPAMRRLKEAFPHATFTALVGSWTKPIWKSAEMIDGTIEFDFFNDRADAGIKEVTESELVSLRDRLAPCAFDLAIDLRRHPETRHILEYTGARLLAGYDLRGRFPWLNIALEWGGDSAREPKRNHAVDELLRLADAVIAACSPEPPILVPQAATHLSLPSDLQSSLFSRSVVCIHPASGDLLKQWPTEYFAELIDMIVERDGVNVVLVGGPKDRDVADAVLLAVAAPDAVFDLVGRLSLSDLPHLLSRCVLFVGNDSGPKHIAAGLGIPTVGIHSGHVDAREWGPVGPLAIALRRDMECSPCYLPSARLCPRDLCCLTGLPPGRVYETCQTLLVARAGGR